jgi:hypothetical protein
MEFDPQMRLALNALNIVIRPFDIVFDGQRRSNIKCSTSLYRKYLLTSSSRGYTKSPIDTIIY